RPSSAEVRAWARRQGMDVSAQGRLRAEIWKAWHAAHPSPPD
ncbi:Lsr2 family DNA-binding protein, partial [Nocardiopsis protaetiae]